MKEIAQVLPRQLDNKNFVGNVRKLPQNVDQS